MSWTPSLEDKRSHSSLLLVFLTMKLELKFVDRPHSLNRRMFMITQMKTSPLSSLLWELTWKLLDSSRQILRYMDLWTESSSSWTWPMTQPSSVSLHQDLPSQLLSTLLTKKKCTCLPFLLICHHMLTPWEKSQLLEKKYQVEEVTQVTCTLISQPSMKELVESLVRTVPSLNYPSWQCQMMISPIQFPLLLAISQKDRFSLIDPSITDKSIHPSMCFHHYHV